MKLTKILLTAILSVLASQSGAADFFSVYIRQIDSAPFSSMSTADIVRPAIQVAQPLAALRPENGNLGLIWQNGDTNTASITQNGTGNVGLIRQIGLHNVASIDQLGSSHQALVLQQGQGNYAFIQQR